MSKGNANFKNFLQLMAFGGVIVIALALVLKIIFADNTEVANVLGLIAQIVAYLSTAVFALYFVLAKRNAILTIVYVVAVIAIAVMLIVAPF